MLDIQIVSAVIGLFIGLVLALTGAGGAILALPLLMAGLGLNFQKAAPIVLLAIFVASLIGALQGLKQGIVRYKTALLIAVFGVAFAPIGVKIAHYAPHQILSLILSSVLIFVAFRMWKQALDTAKAQANQTPPACSINPATSKLFWTASCTKRLVLTGSFAGFLSGLLGVGGGFVIVPSLYQVSNFNSATIVATTLASIAIVSISSILSYSNQAPINMQIALPFVVATTLTMLMLGRLRSKIPQHISQKGFAVLCLIAAIYLVLFR